MKYQETKNALQDLIIRLQDAEKGFKAVAEKTKNDPLRQRLNQYSKERHLFHQALEEQVKNLGGEPEVKTSILGDMHRMFINFKMELIDEDLESVVNEIERGSKKLIEDFENVINKVELPGNIESILKIQQAKIVEELDSLKTLRDQFETMNA